MNLRKTEKKQMGKQQQQQQNTRTDDILSKTQQTANIQIRSKIISFTIWKEVFKSESNDKIGWKFLPSALRLE